MEYTGESAAGLELSPCQLERKGADTPGFPLPLPLHTFAHFCLLPLTVTPQLSLSSQAATSPQVVARTTAQYLRPCSQQQPLLVAARIATSLTADSQILSFQELPVTAQEANIMAAQSWGFQQGDITLLSSQTQRPSVVKNPSAVGLHLHLHHNYLLFHFVLSSLPRRGQQSSQRSFIVLVAYLSLYLYFLPVPSYISCNLFISPSLTRSNPLIRLHQVHHEGNELMLKWPERWLSC